MKRKAVDSFTGKSGMRLNCAQAVARAGKEEFGVTDAEIEAFAVCGGGRAAGGMCGAIYAAQELIARQSKEDAVKAVDAFCAYIGAIGCKEIKAAKKYSCMDCVAEAAHLTEKYVRRI